jgi:hypothetical protein
MAEFPDLSNEALDAMNTDAGTTDTSDGHPAPTDGVSGELPIETKGAEQTPAQLQAVADLSKYKEVTINGQKMSIDDLQKSIMRQADYTKKTQEVATERKYNANLAADLDKVKANPALASEFKRLYPAQYHAYLKYVMDSAQQAPAPQPGQLPPELMDRFNRYDQFIDETSREKIAAQEQALEANLQTFETNLIKKYPKADAFSAYGYAENKIRQIEQETGQKVSPKDLNEQFMEPFFKASHDNLVKQFNQWNKEQAKQARNTNQVAADTGRGGGTPGAAPGKIALKNVADEILRGAIN